MQFHALIERAASDAWPAAVSEPLGEWRLRYDPVVPSKRCNSVLSAGALPDRADWMDRIREFYAERGAPVRFQVGAASPPELDVRLEAEGYKAEVPCVVMTMRLQGDIGFSGNNAHVPPRQWSSLPDDEWLEAWRTMEGHPERTLDGFREMMRVRIGAPARYGCIRMDGRIAAVSSAVVHGRLSGLFNVIVHPDYRRLGLAESLVRGLVSWSREQGADTMYLQAVRDNEPALRLYAKLGFAISHRYHYRTLDPLA
ncbi:GNAT family N-acetyltransferase [Paenibacillus thermoaerophilus]